MTGPGSSTDGDWAIRVATPADAEGVAALLSASYTVLMRGAYDRAVLAAALPVMTRANAELLCSGTYFVAVAADGTTIGCGGISAVRPGTADAEPGVGHIRHFATHPDWLRRGIGRRIMECSVKRARDLGLCSLECYSSLNAVDFYAAEGFVVVAEVTVPIAGQHPLPAILMRRDL